MSDNKPSDERNGSWLDSMWCCKVCDGEIPHGHTDNCDIWKLEKKHRDFIANEYNAALIERDRLREALSNLMPMLAECDCIYSDRAEPPCPCRAARNALSANPSIPES